MRSFIVLSALAAIASAAPHAKRDVVWVTDTAVVTEVVQMTKTVWIDETGATESPAVQAQKNAVPAQQDNNDAPHRHANFHAAAPAAPQTTPATTPAAAPQVAAKPVVTSTTSVYVAPAPQTTPSTYAAPTPAPVQSSAPAPAPEPAPESSAPASYSPPSGGSGNCADQSGECTGAKFTYYTPGLGSCGQTNSDSDYIFAYGKDLMAAKGGANPNLNPLCGRKIQIKAHDGTMITATLADTCYACGSDDSMIDLSQGLWDRIAKGSSADGVMSDMSFTWMS